MRLTPKNWAEFQHYKDRAPAWIKLHRKLLDDYDYACLPVASKALAPMLWLLASEYEGGVIDASLRELAFRLRMTEGELSDALNPLIQSKFFDVEQDASEPLAECKQNACLEKRREEEEIETEKIGASAPDGRYAFDGKVVRLTRKSFDDWVKAYPNLDLRGELTARDAYLASDKASDADRKNWFMSTSQHLANRNMTAKAKVVAMKSDGQPLTKAQQLYREGIV